MTTESATGPKSARVSDTGLDAVTGGFSYSGRAIATALTDSGRQVRTLTGHPNRRRAGPPLRFVHSTSTTRLAWSRRSKVSPRSITPTGCASPISGSTTTWP